MPSSYGRSLAVAAVVFVLAVFPIAHAQGNPEAADQDCSAGNYTCDYHDQPPTGEAGPCMLNKSCNPNVSGGSVTGICEALDMCRATSCSGEVCTKSTGTAGTGNNIAVPSGPSFPEDIGGYGALSGNNFPIGPNEIPIDNDGNIDAGVIQTTLTSEPSTVFNETTGQYEGPPAEPANESITTIEPMQNPPSPLTQILGYPEQLAPEYQPAQSYQLPTAPNYAGLIGGYTAPDAPTPAEEFYGPSDQQATPYSYQYNGITFTQVYPDTVYFQGGDVPNPEEPFGGEGSSNGASPPQAQSTLSTVINWMNSTWSYLKSML